MGLASRSGRCIERTVSIPAVGAVNVDALIPDCVKGWIRRVEAKVTAGTAINQVAVILSRTSTNAGVWDQVYSSGALAAQPLDDQVDIWYSQPDHTPDALYALVQVDNATTDHVVQVRVFIELPG
jgi:hypothetical protein